MNGLNRATLRATRRLGFFFVFAGASAPCWANHIPTGIDLGGYRTKMPGEGYLAHTVNPAVSRFGEEWTGWVDIRHPSLVGTADLDFGYDRSDRRYDVNSNILKDANSMGMPDRARDFNFANKAYMLQAGVSVIETGLRTVTADMAGAPNFTIGLSFAEEQAIMPAMNAAAPTIETYYAGSNMGGNSLDSAAFAETYNPSLLGGAALNEALFMADQPAVRTDTFSHELFHFAGDGLAVHAPIGDPGTPGDATDDDFGHSQDVRNLIAAGGFRLTPGGPVFNRMIPSHINDIGPRMSATVGGMDQLITTQADRMLNNAGASPWFQRTDNGGAAGDHVDWDFVVDHNQFANDHDNNASTPALNFGLEGVTGADNHPGVESLYWGIQPTIASSQVGKNKTGLGTFPATPDFAGQMFRTADVFSLGLRYSDSDVNLGGTLSQRETALDYNLFFRLMDGTFVQGIPQQVFIGGWTGNTFADNFLARWYSPVDAVGVFIFALNNLGHDGVTQIDAVIVSAIPEPGTLVFIIVGLLLAGIPRARP